MIAETFVQLLRDPAHWEFEIFLMVLFDGLVVGVGWRQFKRWLARHDATQHGATQTRAVCPEHGVVVHPHYHEARSVTTEDFGP